MATRTIAREVAGGPPTRVTGAERTSAMRSDERSEPSRLHVYRVHRVVSLSSVPIGNVICEGGRAAVIGMHTMAPRPKRCLRDFVVLGLDLRQSVRFGPRSARSRHDRWGVASARRAALTGVSI